MDAQTLITNAPWFSHALAGGMMLLGIVLWLFGGKALRISFTAFGAAGGVIIALALPPEVADGAVRWGAIVVGALVGALLGGAAFRFSVAAVLGVTLLAVVPIVTYDLIDRYGSPVEAFDENTPLAESEMLMDGVTVLPDGVDPGTFIQENNPLTQSGDAQTQREAMPDTTTAGERWKVWSQRCRVFLTELSEEYGRRIDKLPERDQSLLVLSCLAGLVVGFAMGISMQKTSAIIVAAGMGGILFLPSAVWLMNASTMDTTWLPGTPMSWVMVWVGLSAIGALAQRFLVNAYKKKPAPAPAAA